MGQRNIREGHTYSRGERNGAAKLDREKVRAIRADARLYKILAHEYGVQPGTISRIKTGKIWAHV
jgi:hypothetical protein